MAHLTTAKRNGVPITSVGLSPLNKRRHDGVHGVAAPVRSANTASAAR
jgi:hypothetical protein